MTLNQLLFNHQLAQMNASRAIVRLDGACNFDMERHYAKRIREWRRVRGLSANGWPGGFLPAGEPKR